MTSPARNVAPAAGAVIVAVGGLPTLIVIGVDTELFVPSETVSRITYRPGVAYVCEGLAAVDRMPSPKSHEYVRDCPSGSLEPVLEKFTRSARLIYQRLSKLDAEQSSALRDQLQHSCASALVH